uniref:Uncharacterized protein n=1 Tax=Trichobilharzia regenti TaxID=157069 RepID=A0AA85KAM4_TRIRE|nr:unnamed protein product [Trichobilharzia regenti]
MNNTNAKPFITKITKNVNDDIINDNDYNTGDNNELTSYDEIRRIFQEDPIHDKQPTKTTSSPMTTTTVKPEKEEEEEENDLGLNEADDESSPCSGGDDDSQTDSGRQDYDTVGAEEDYDYYQMIPWFRRDQNRRPSRGSYRKPMRGTWYSSDHYFPFYIPH